MVEEMNLWLRWFQFAVIRNTGLAMLVVVNWQWVNLTRKTAGSFAIDLIPGQRVRQYVHLVVIHL